MSEFGGYRDPLTEARIQRWLAQFTEGDDRDIAARILDCIEMVPELRISNDYERLLNSMPGWHVNKNKRSGNFLFVPYTSNPGQSGDSMIHLFRDGSRLSHSRHDELFGYRSDIARLTFNPSDTIAFVNDFAGTGDQTCEWWDSHFRELVSGDPKIYLLLSRITRDAKHRIERDTPIKVKSTQILKGADNFFSPECTRFSDDEKSRILQYCTVAYPAHPRGYGNCGLLLVFDHDCPNNSLPILYAINQRWEPLFPRHG